MLAVIQVMGAVYSISDETASSLLLALVSANIVALVSLAGDGASLYLSKQHCNTTELTGPRIRLQLLRVFLTVISIAAGLKLVLAQKLADDLIAAWFVGQGFALQDILRNIVTGIAVRYNDRVRCMVGTKVQHNDIKYTVCAANLASITLETEDGSHSRIVPWTEVYSMKLLSN